MTDGPSRGYRPRRGALSFPPIGSRFLQTYRLFLGLRADDVGLHRTLLATVLCLLGPGPACGTWVGVLSWHTRARWMLRCAAAGSRRPLDGPALLALLVPWAGGDHTAARLVSFLAPSLVTHRMGFLG